MIVILPVRSRPKNLPRFLDSWIKCKTQAALLIAADADDPDLQEYKAIHERYTGRIAGAFSIGVAPRGTLCTKLNEWSRQMLWYHDIIGFLADDIVCRTENWDVTIIDRMKDLGDVGVIHPNDMIQNGAIPTHVFMSSNIIKTLGYMCPPKLVHLYIDNAWKTIGETLGKLHWERDVIMEHHHPIAGKAEWDDIYRLANNAQRWEEDSRVFEEWKNEGSYIEPLRSLING